MYQVIERLLQTLRAGLTMHIIYRITTNNPAITPVANITNMD